MAAVAPATAQTQATKVKQEVVIGDQHVAWRHGKARAQGTRGTTTAIHVGLGLDQQHWLAVPVHLSKHAVIARTGYPFGPCLPRQIVDKHKADVMARSGVAGARIA